MIQKITQNNWNFWTVNLITRAKKLLSSRQIFQYAVPSQKSTGSRVYQISSWLGLCHGHHWESLQCSL